MTGASIGVGQSIAHHAVSSVWNAFTSNKETNSSGKLLEEYKSCVKENGENDEKCNIIKKMIISLG